MKKTVLFTLAIIITFFFAACGNADDTPDAPVEGQVTAEQQAGGEASAAPSSAENATPATSAEGGAKTEGIPEEYVGKWEGSTGDIKLTFDVNADGTGVYTFEQGGYIESYDFTLEIGTETFFVHIPKDNTLGITECEGTYEYSDGVMILDIHTSFSDGRVFEYTVACE